MTPIRTVAPIRCALRAVTLACVPASQRLTEEGWDRAEEIVGETLAQRQPSVRRQVVMFVRVLGVLGFLRYGKGLERLGPERMRALLASLESGPLLLLRRGTWGLRTLAFMGYYGQPSVRGELGYAAALRGWESRGALQGSWPERAGAAPPEAGVLTAPGGDLASESSHGAGAPDA